jgi:hypothetical protein
VARLPSSKPAAASTNTPEQIDTMRPPRSCARLSATNNAREGVSSMFLHPGMTIVCADLRADSPARAVIVTPPTARRGRLSADAT